MIWISLCGLHSKENICTNEDRHTSRFISKWSLKNLRNLICSQPVLLSCTSMRFFEEDNHVSKTFYVPINQCEVSRVARNRIIRY